MIHPEHETLRAISRLGMVSDFHHFAEFLESVEKDETATLLSADRESLPEARARALAFHDINELIQSASAIVQKTEQLSATETPHM